MRRIAFALAALALLAAACGDGDGAGPTELRDATGLSGPETAGLGAEGDTSSTTGGETTTTGEETTTTAATGPCPLPQPLPRGVTFDPALVRLHRAATAFAESAVLLSDALEAASDYSGGWGAREPVASAFFRMQADLYGLASRIERTYAAAGATYDPDAGWVFPEDPYPLSALEEPWQQIPEYQAVTLTGFFEMENREDAVAFFEGGGVCRLVAAFSAAMDQASADSGA